MTKKWKYMLLGLLVVATLAVVYANDIDKQIEKNQKELEDIQNRLQEVDDAADETQDELTQVEKDIRALEKEIRARETKISELNGSIDLTTQAITIKTVELEEAEKEVAYQNDKMEKRLRVMYKAGNFGYLEVLMGAADFSDLLTRVDKVQLLLDYDQDTLRALIEAKEFVEQAKLDLEIKNQELKAFKEEVELEKVKLEASVTLMEQKKAELEADKVALARQYDSLEEDAEKVTKIIKELEIRRKYVGGTMMWPLDLTHTRISSEYGPRRHPILGDIRLHTGIDIAAPKDSPIYAAQTGVVIYSGWLGSYGKCVMIDHGGGIITLYGHNNTLKVSVGQEVTKGDVIAGVGSTGRSTGNHLHFEVRVNGDYKDPYEYVTNPN